MQTTPEEVYENCYSILSKIIENNHSFSVATYQALNNANGLIASTTNFDLKKKYCYMLACARDALEHSQQQNNDISEKNLTICKYILLDFRKRCAPLFNKMQSFLPTKEPVNKRLQM